MLTELQHNSNSLNTGLFLDGNVAYRIDNDRVIINLDSIRSDRHDGDISGTLSLELWALNRPYNGDDFEGQALAGTQIGEMLGQHFLSDCEYDLIFNAPSAGNWALCLMLREWNGESFQTCDFRNFDVPYQAEPELHLVETAKTEAKAEAKVVDINAKREAAPAKIESKPETKAESAKAAPAKAAQKKTEAKKTEEKKAEPVAKKSTAKTPAAPKAAPKTAANKPVAKDVVVSVNTATSAELAAVKGLSAKQAEAIVSGRPYKSVDDVIKAKGMGAKLLEKVRSSLKI